MNIVARRLIVVAAFTLTAGCAGTDWIERTLVTVDVTGVWSGRAYIPHATAGLIIDVRLDLEQEGAKVKGSMRPSGSISWRSPDLSPATGLITGTVAGDVLDFTETNGHITGHLTVSGDEMTGEVVAQATYWVVLRRGR
jgi:hypothetical protein